LTLLDARGGVLAKALQQTVYVVRVAAAARLAACPRPGVEARSGAA
jgi:hypothetical protein